VFYVRDWCRWHQALLAFLQWLSRRFPIQQVYLILDNYSTHRHRKVKAWCQAYPHFHFHFTPTYSSWLNPVEYWFSVLQRHGLAHGSFVGVAELRATLGRNVRGRNSHAVPPALAVLCRYASGLDRTCTKNLRNGAPGPRAAATGLGCPAPGCTGRVLGRRTGPQGASCRSRRLKYATQDPRAWGFTTCQATGMACWRQVTLTTSAPHASRWCVGSSARTRGSVPCSPR
jgi:hypothetical protein